MDHQSLIETASFWSSPALRDNLLICLNILGALLLGIVVGYERTWNGRAAGIRTYGFVCMASAALTVVVGYPASWYGDKPLPESAAIPPGSFKALSPASAFSAPE